jgi:isoleucyl-tRNA synthetase
LHLNFFGELKYREYKYLDLPKVSDDVLKLWKENGIFKKSITSRPDTNRFVFYEGPPSANGLPGIHHVIGRTIKDVFCRYKTLKGFQVKRKSGWDTHGLPVELQVEKRLGLKKEDIGKKISVAEYNEECRKDVMKFQDTWEELTEKIGFWLDLENPYITYDRNYIETLWYLLKELFKKDLLYRGYTIQPFSPAAGTGLSSHEINQPGCYKMVKDTSLTAQFKILSGQDHPLVDALLSGNEDTFILAWTTTPWTLPSNAALAVGENITYLKVKTYNQYTGIPVNVILAKDTLYKYFKIENAALGMQDYHSGQKEIPYKISGEITGKELAGLKYEQLLPYVTPEEEAFKVIIGDFVTTDEGTGVVHIAPTFGADDFRVAKQQGIPAITVPDEENPNRQIPLVDRKGRFVPQVTDFAGRFVKNYEDDDTWSDVNIDIAVKLKSENRAFRVEKYEHTYPHCWRTDKPVLYYPLESWFIRTTAFKEKLIEHNNTINWKPASTGTGRFGNWLENLVDWNLSRSRYWGTPLPIWATENGEEFKCIGSISELKEEVDKAIDAGIDQKTVDLKNFDPHRPFVDEVFLVSESGKRMSRIPDVVDVWFDSGAMPYAQLHYPFENKEEFAKYFPADFIAEGVDQTRGWFFTLHAIAVMLFDSVAFKNVVANGLVLDKDGNKMSKRLGNAIDPFETVEKYGADATRWYLVHNSQPWDNLKFDLDGVDEIRKKFFGTLYNVYSFYALYANIDGFSYQEEKIPVSERPELDRWIISLLNTLVKNCEEHLENYEPTRAVREIQDFVNDHLSNWYVRLSRRRFWKGEYSSDKISAYQTLYECLVTLSQLMSPFAPFYSERLFLDLNEVSGKHKEESVHLTYFPETDFRVINKDLEERMDLAQDISSQVLSLRKRSKIKVRQPLGKIMVPVLDEKMKRQIEQVKELVLAETNVKRLEYVDDASGILVKKIKPDFRKLGPKVGPKIKLVQQKLNSLNQQEISAFEREGYLAFSVNGEAVKVEIQDVEVLSEDIPGWLVNSSGKTTVALDVTITEDLKDEGIARELINRIQNLRKEKDFEVTDHIEIKIQPHPVVNSAVQKFQGYICTETLADELHLADPEDDDYEVQIEEISLKLNIKRK